MESLFICVIMRKAFKKIYVTVCHHDASFEIYYLT